MSWLSSVGGVCLSLFRSGDSHKSGSLENGTPAPFTPEGWLLSKRKGGYHEIGMGGYFGPEYARRDPFVGSRSLIGCYQDSFSVPFS